MYCKNLCRRSYRKQQFWYCKYKKQQIALECCKKCLDFQFRLNRPINKKSNKLKKLERDRDKNLIKKGICENCKKYSNRLDPHEIYGGSNRQRSIKVGFVALICPNCHKDEEKILKMRVERQIEYEKNHTREEFIQLIGKSYLE